MPDLAILELRKEWEAHRALMADIGAALTKHGFLKPPQKEKRGTVWVNVWQRPGGEIAVSHHATRDQADQLDGVGVQSRLACVAVEWTEGDGL